MIPTDVMISLDGLGFLLLTMMGVWFIYGGVKGWIAILLRKDGDRHTAEASLTVGLGLALLTLAERLFLAMIMRQLALMGDSAIWFMNTWPFAVSLVQGTLAGLFSLRGITCRRWGEWPWIAALCAIIVGLFWHWPARALLIIFISEIMARKVT